MFLPLLASAAHQAIWGVGFAAVIALVVLVPWKSPSTKDTGSQAPQEPLPPQPVPEPTPVEPEPTPIEPELVLHHHH